jgi:phosphopantetheinyl transferase
VQKKIKANSKKQTQMLAIASQWFKLNHINRYQSISHSGNYCICIDAAFPVGIDLESIDRKVNWKKIQQRFFTKKEQHLIHDQVTFTKAWTKKEALYKMLDQFTNTTKWTDLTTCSKKYHFVTKQIDDKYLFTFCF